MALNRTKSKGLGNLTIGDANSKNVTSGSVGSDGRVKVQIHQNVQSFVARFKHFQGPPTPTVALKKRRSSTVALPQGQKPTTNPRLNIAIHIIGSRGDVQPFIPIAQLLSRPPYCHRVRICTYPVFKDFVESQSVEFFSIGGDPEAMMAYMVKNPGLLPSRESVKAGDVGKRRQEMWDIINGAWRSCIEAGNGMREPVRAAHVPEAKDLFIADAIIANPPSMAHIHCAEKLGIPLHMVFTMPWSPTETFSHPLASMNYGDTDAAVANYFSFMIMELLTWQGLGDLINKFRTQILCLDPISPMWGFQLLPRLRVPYSYLWSQSLIPKPSDWGSHISITGFSFLSLANSYTPPADLVDFLERGPPPIYVGFGSIVVDDPQALTRLIFYAVKLAGVRAIVSKGWGGVGSGDDVPETIYLIGNCPHDWLFQRVSAVVHHGGAGTTAAGIAAGRPTVVVPFFGDQPFWGQMIARAGAGPTPVPFKEMTAETLAASITFALKPEVQEAVQDMAQHIGMEDGAGDTARDIQERLGISLFRCDICPDKLAVWQHKATGAHLSCFAAACLADKGLLEPRDIKLLRHKHWYVDEGAEHPIIGVVAAASNFVTTLGTAASGYSQRLKVRPRSSKRANEATPAQPSSSDTHKDMDQVTLGANPDVHQVSLPATRGSDQQAPANRGGDQGAITEPTNPAQLNDDGVLKDAIRLTPTEMENFAHKMATKSVRSGETATYRMKRAPALHERQKAAWKAQEQGRHGQAFYITRATGRFAADVTKAGLKAPVALFYNVANGFHNYPSYSLHAMEVRRRDEITGLGSGVRTAGKEVVLGFWDAFSGVVVKPYEGAKTEGAKGFGKGVLNGGLWFVYNLGASIFGLPSYTLKGIEKEFSKHHLTKLKAEIFLIRLRQGIEAFRQATPEEKEIVVKRWKCMRPQ
ncbi:glycosyltransferase family 28 domain-containing protein [Dactylonectria estremocensis]|uniref:Glycosyltransferase family 28 domain-containing protein n=1 Tax=Dactylonectria estremocensis TaxID=1079267 RepID=A0A9P9I6V2_9HYPO|nr:glycosyltransferase family 28 domain-containing protein [Dactylonectria estremocensis]